MDGGTLASKLASFHLGQRMGEDIVLGLCVQKRRSLFPQPTSIKIKKRELQITSSTKKESPR